ncbi:MAG: YhgE/Pip domain-containing protein, partial [Clostridiales bacterium]|nr:YhgE/Pip domain-containing protein [Clostridiales bacterium]
LFTSASLSFAAEENTVSDPDTAVSEKAEIKAKDEVIYAILGCDGSVQDIYAVNSFALEKAGSITDYGDYTSVKNLTDTSILNQEGDAVTIQAEAESFYYQGNISETELPWIFDIEYFLNGAKITPEELGGKSGELEITIKSRQNTAVDPVFYENYMQQITVTLDSEKCLDIEASGATLANAGKDKVIVFTVMPRVDADISLKAEVKDFTMTGIDISAMPFSMSVEIPDMSDMVSGFSGLANGISSLNQGVGSLTDGVAELQTGTAGLTKGSSDIKAGLFQLDNNSGQLLQASEQIGDALTQLASALNGSSSSGGMDLGELPQLPIGLSQLADALDSMSAGLVELKNGFTPAYAALDNAIQSIPTASVSQEQIAALYAQTDPSLNGALDGLVTSYTSAQTVKGTYNQVKGAFDAVGSTIDTLSPSIATISVSLNEMANKINEALSGADMLVQLAQLSEGLTELDRNYAKFHNGLTDYMVGVGDLSSGYSDFHSGLSIFGGGIGELYGGAAKLYEGTKQLNYETAKLPDTIQSEIDGMLNSYTGSDFEVVSFTSEKNENTDLVQFVLKCKGIENPEEVKNKDTELEAPKETFGDRWAALFTIKKED